MSIIGAEFLSQLEQLNTDLQKILKPLENCFPAEICMHVIMKVRAAIERAFPASSSYVRQLQDTLQANIVNNETVRAKRALGILTAAVDDLRAGFTKSVEELVHGEIFSDYLEMAEHLVHEGYKDPAAVVAGSTLESHLRQLCTKAGIPIEQSDSSGNVKRNKADTLNSELAAASVHSKLDLKHVTAWLDLRNKAAHGNYSDYNKEQVSLMVSSIRDYITRVPA